MFEISGHPNYEISYILFVGIQQIKTQF